MIFLVLFLIPVFLILANFLLFKTSVTLKEFLLQIGIQAAIAGISVAIIYNANTSDTEIHNGRIADKKRKVVSCRHSYSCNCYTTCSSNGKSTSCSTHCSTCYEHSHDVDWLAYTTNNETIDINTIDRQGVNEPPRWTSIKIGEPTSLSYSYINYVKACPDTLFRKSGQIEKYAATIPSYPLGVFDYYRLNRLVQVGTNLPDPDKWNQDLSEINGDLGAKKQVNAVMVLVANKSEDYFYALEQAWIGGKKNDVIPIIGVSVSTAGYTIDWVRVMAWTDQSIFKVKLRDDLKDIGNLNREQVMKALRDDIDSQYKRKHMKDFKYLMASITPTKCQWIVSIIIGILVCIGVSIFVDQNDVFDEERRKYRW